MKSLVIIFLVGVFVGAIDLISLKRKGKTWSDTSIGSVIWNFLDEFFS